jgi:2-polyprenyl-3-methyl-5-hydroxy-6-metoxy-1,4-benzoquinol methylase
VASEDWQPNHNVSAWADANGSDEWPFGDAWRMALINPVILNLAAAVQHGFTPTMCPPLYAGLAAQRKILLGQTSPAELVERMKRWHQEPVEDTAAPLDLPGVRLLDLGCGEAYLSRWLARFGIAYRGDDCSPGLLEIANCRRTALTEYPALNDHIYDLTDLSTLDVSQQQKYDEFGPNLVTAIASLDHLPNPMPFLDSLSRFLARRGDAHVPFLAVTLNPHAYKRFETDKPFVTNVPSADWFPRESLGMVHSVQIGSTVRKGAQEDSDTKSGGPPGVVSVHAYFRTLHEWERIFTRSGFHVLDASPLQFSERVLPVKVHFARQAPFHAWILYPKKRGRPLASNEVSSLIPTGSLFSSELETIMESADDLELIDFSKGERILYPQNLGSEVFVLVRGKAVRATGGRTPMQSFVGGEIMGELEAETPRDFGATETTAISSHNTFLSRRYVAAVESSRDPIEVLTGDKSGLDEAPGASLLKIPGHVFERITRRSEKRVTNVLFDQLRDKVLLNLMKAPSSITKDEEKTWASVSKTYISKWTSKGAPFGFEGIQTVARGLVYLSVMEANDPSRDTDGHIVFCGREELGHLMEDRLNDDEIHSCLDFFHSIGLIERPLPLLFDSFDGSKGIDERNQSPVVLSAEYPNDGGQFEEIERSRWPLIVENCWKTIKGYAFDGIVLRYFESAVASGNLPTSALERAKKIYDSRLDYVDNQASLLGSSSQGITRNKRDNKLIPARSARSDFERCSTAITRINNNEDAARLLAAKWMANICYVQDHLLRSVSGVAVKGGKLIRILAPHELRHLAFDDPKDCYERVGERGKAFPELDLSGNIELKKIRLAHFYRFAEEFIVDALSFGADIRMTAADHFRSLRTVKKTWWDVADYRQAFLSCEPSK